MGIMQRWIVQIKLQHLGDVANDADLSPALEIVKVVHYCVEIKSEQGQWPRRRDNPEVSCVQE